MTKKTELNRDQKLSILQEKYGRKDKTIGCEVEYEDSETLGDGGIAVYIDSFPKEYLHDCFRSAHIYKKKDSTTFLKGLNKDDSQNLEIIGHPLTLSDVLFNVKKPLLVDRNGIFYNLKLKALNIGKAWDLEQGLLRDQSDGTVDFVFEILNPT